MRKAAAISPNEFDNFLSYINAIDLVEVVADGDSGISFMSDSGYGIGSSDDTVIAFFNSSFESGVQLSNKTLREESLTNNLSKWLNKAISHSSRTNNS